MTYLHQRNLSLRLSPFVFLPTTDDIHSSLIHLLNTRHLTLPAPLPRRNLLSLLFCSPPSPSRQMPHIDLLSITRKIQPSSPFPPLPQISKFLFPEEKEKGKLSKQKTRKPSFICPLALYLILSLIKLPLSTASRDGRTLSR
jgi:hypothetical protein